MNYGLYNLKRVHARTGLKSALIAVLATVLSCSPGPKPDCKQPFVREIKPIKLQNKHELVFNIDDFDFVNDRNYVIESVMLEGEITLHNSRKSDIAISMNGVKAFRKDGRSQMEFGCGDSRDKKDNDKDHDRGGDRSKDRDDDKERGDRGRKDYEDKDAKRDCKESHRFCSPAHFFSLNGGISVLDFLAKIKKNKGSLVIKVAGKNHELKNIKLVVKGTRYQKCEAPIDPPPPPPAPVAPKTTILNTDPVISPTGKTTKTISFSADQSGVGFYCALDGAPAALCTSPVAYSDLGNGEHQFVVYAKNASGLVDINPPKHQWVVDSVAPDVKIDNLASLKSVTSADGITFEFSSNDPAAIYTCQIDKAAAASCSSPVSYSNVAEGSHSFSVTSIDSVGNVSPAPATFAWVVDKTAPVTSIVSVVPAAAVNNSQQIEIQFAANEAATFECNFANQGYQSCSSPHKITNIAEGDHSILIRSIDTAGNVGLPAAHSWKSDLTAPQIIMGNVVPVPGITGANSVSADFVLSEPGATFCSFDGASATPCASPFVKNVNVQGSHQLVISAQDEAGNQAALVQINWNMDFLLPEIRFGNILPSTASFINVNSLSAQVLPNKEVQLRAKLNGADLGVVQSPLQLNGLSDGAYTLQVSGSDQVGNYSNTISHNFVVDTAAPTLALVSQVTGVTRLDSNQLTFSANEVASFKCNVDSAGFGDCQSPLNLSGLAEGNHAVQVYAIDEAGNVSATASASWSIDTTAPVTTLAANQLASDSIDFALQSSEANSQFLCSLDGAAASPCGANVNYAGLSVGSHSFAAFAVDAAGNKDVQGAIYNFVVKAPIVTTITSTSPSTSATALRSMVIGFVGSDAGSFECSIDGGAFLPCSSPLSLSGMADGNHNVQIRGYDTFGTRGPAASHSWSVDGTAPVTSLISNMNGINAVTYQFSSSEANSTFECSFDGAAASACTSPLTFSTLASGDHSFWVWATDSLGNKDLVGASHAFNVSLPLTTTIVSKSPDALYTSSTGITFTFTSSHSNATFVCSLNGATALPCSSPMSYAELGDGAYTFKVQAVAANGTIDAVGAGHNWNVDTAAPFMVTVNTSATSSTITVTWTTNEPTTTKLIWGKDLALDKVVPEDGVYTNTHSVRLTGLSPNSVYSLQPAGKDRAGNAFTATKFTGRTTR